jgi:hypothetical protein
MGWRHPSAKFCTTQGCLMARSIEFWFWSCKVTIISVFFSNDFVRFSGGHGSCAAKGCFLMVHISVNPDPLWCLLLSFVGRGLMRYKAACS